MRKLPALALWTCFSATLLSGCHTVRAVEALPTPADKLVCEAAGPRPKIPPEYQIDWAKVTTVAQARAEHEKYVASVRSREGVEVAYILKIEGQLYVCSSNMQWRRDYEKGLANG